MTKKEKTIADYRLSAKQKLILQSLKGGPMSRQAIDAHYGNAASSTWVGASSIRDGQPVHVKWDDQARAYLADPASPDVKRNWRWVSLLGLELVKVEKAIGPKGLAIDYVSLTELGEKIVS